jgi:hypothetical protein
MTTEDTSIHTGLAVTRARDFFGLCQSICLYIGTQLEQIPYGRRHVVSLPPGRYWLTVRGGWRWRYSSPDYEATVRPNEVAGEAV